MKSTYLKGSIFLLKLLACDIEEGCFVKCCLALDDTLVEHGIPDSTTPLKQFYRILDGDQPMEPRSDDARDFRRGARDMMNFLGSGQLDKAKYHESDCKRCIDDAVDIGLMCAVCLASSKREDTSHVSGKLLFCSRYKSRAYCLKKCQNADWKQHKPDCRAFS